MGHLQQLDRPDFHVFEAEQEDVAKRNVERFDFPGGGGVHDG